MARIVEKDGQYSRRGVGLDAMKSTESDIYRHIVEYARNPQNGLDIQLRGGYINIYYKGGNLLKLSFNKKNPFHDSFDKWYFYKAAEDSVLTKSDIERLRQDDCISWYEETSKKSGSRYERYRIIHKNIKEYQDKAETIYNDLLNKRDNMLQRLQSCKEYNDVASIMEEIKNVMDEWKNSLKEKGSRKSVTGERVIQHYISLYNKEFSKNTDYIVLDIEYAISAHAKYRDDRTPDKQPRIDIVAIEKGTGQLYVMELKYGMGVVDGDAGIDVHYSDYLNTVGAEDKWSFFWNDIYTLLTAKKELGFFSKSEDVFLKKAKPKFAFIMKLQKETDKQELKESIESSTIIPNNVPVFYLPVEPDEYSSVPSADGLQLSEKYIQ